MATECFIDDKYIKSLIETTKETTDKKITEILDKAERLEGLSHEEVAALLNTENKSFIQRIFKIAGQIKDSIYGQRVVIFAPLYISDYCINNCDYCGFKCTNKFERRRLTMDEIREEIKILEKMGHKRLALEAGEDPKNCTIDYILDSIKTIYDMKFESGEIRRVNINIAATTVEEYKLLHEAGIGTYILFQETYNKEIYEKVHIGGPKRNYMHHTYAFDRAMEAGIEDVGGGVLFGLYDPKYEVISLMIHNEHLENRFGVGLHTISMPRIRAAEGTLDNKYEYAVEDELFKKLTAIVRIAVPYTGLIISTRETPSMRKELINLGVSQLSAGSSVDVGGYTNRENSGSQFDLADNRSAQEIIYWLMEEGLVPSFCTACYRQGRTGDRFMALAKSGDIKNVCLPNGLMTLKEYSLDYGTEEFKQKANELIQSKLDSIGDIKVRDLVIENLKLFEQGKRDLYL